MTPDPDHLSREWTEVRLVPSSPNAKEGLLLQVIDPLIHNELARTIESWHYFWEPELLLRIHWQDPIDASENQDKLFSYLTAAQTAGHLSGWEDRPYTGEEPDYGKEMWNESFHDWMKGSELALAIIKFEADGRLTKPRQYHWQRRVHLFSNQLGLSYFGEGICCLGQAIAYLDHAAKHEEAEEVAGRLPPDKRLISRDDINDLDLIQRRIEGKLRALAAAESGDGK